jgi:hypothetical protein
MSNGEEAIRIRQAEFLSAIFEKENGRPAETAEEIGNWLSAKSKIERDEIRRRMEAYLSSSSS